MIAVSRRRLNADSRIVLATSRIAAMIRMIATAMTAFRAPLNKLYRLLRTETSPTFCTPGTPFIGLHLTPVPLGVHELDPEGGGDVRGGGELDEHRQVRELLFELRVGRGLGLVGHVLDAGQVAQGGVDLLLLGGGDRSVLARRAELRARAQVDREHGIGRASCRE